MKKFFVGVLMLAALGAGAACVNSSTPQQPVGLVDLTHAAESSVNSVVYIKVTAGGKT